MENTHLAAVGSPASVPPALSPWELLPLCLGQLASGLPAFGSPEWNFQDHNLWAAPLLRLPLRSSCVPFDLFLLSWISLFFSPVGRLTTFKGSSCHRCRGWRTVPVGAVKKGTEKVLRVGGRRKARRGPREGEAADQHTN